MTTRRPAPGGPEVGVLRALEARLGRPVALVWTANRSVYLSLRPRGRDWALRVHRVFRGAPEPVWSALGEYLATGRRAALAPARAHFDRHRAAQPERPAPRLRAAGATHDLSRALAEARRHGPFDGLPPVVVGWGRRTRPGRRTLRLGSYRAGSPGVIRIHPLLDRPEVPFWAVCQVVHHELVHHYRHWVEGRAEGRRHDRRFRALEAGFPELARAQEWQARSLRLLICRGRRGGAAGGPIEG